MAKAGADFDNTIESQAEFAPYSFGRQIRRLSDDQELPAWHQSRDDADKVLADDPTVDREVERLRGVFAEMMSGVVGYDNFMVEFERFLIECRSSAERIGPRSVSVERRYSYLVRQLLPSLEADSLDPFSGESFQVYVNDETGPLPLPVFLPSEWTAILLSPTFAVRNLQDLRKLITKSRRNPSDPESVSATRNPGGKPSRAEDPVMAEQAKTVAKLVALGWTAPDIATFLEWTFDESDFAHAAETKVARYHAVGVGLVNKNTPGWAEGRSLPTNGPPSRDGLRARKRARVFEGISMT